MRISNLRYFTALAFLLCATSASATSFYRPSEDGMIDGADVIARVRVAEIVSAKETLASDTYRISSRITLTPVQCLKGCRSDQASLVVYETGGTVGDQQAMPVDAPDYVVGQERLVFLSRGPDNALRTMNSGVGTIPLLQMPDGSLRMQRGVTSRVATTYDSFRDRLRKRVGLKAVEKPAAFASPPLSGEQQQNAVYRWMGNPGSKWRVPSVLVMLPNVGEPVMGDAGSRQAVVSAINAWRQSGAALDFTIASALVAPQGFVCQEGKLLISFEDPKNEISDPQGCSGVLAIGGFCGSGVTLPDGFQTITSGAFVANNGWASCNFWSATDHRNFDEVATHELGHAIGLAHSRESGEDAGPFESDATMFWMAHFDGRAAGLKAYDTGAVMTLYPAAATPSSEPTASPTPEPTASPSPTATPQTGKCGSAADAGTALVIFGCASLFSLIFGG